jgi:hypothetical protein
MSFFSWISVNILFLLGHLPLLHVFLVKPLEIFEFGQVKKLAGWYCKYPLVVVVSAEDLHKWMVYGFVLICLLEAGPQFLLQMAHCWEYKAAYFFKQGSLSQ